MPLQLKAIAPEFYETLAYHKSWAWVTWKFLSDPEVGPWSRMRRATREPAAAVAAPKQQPDEKAAAMVRARRLFWHAASCRADVCCTRMCEWGSSRCLALDAGFPQSVSIGIASTLP